MQYDLSNTTALTNAENPQSSPAPRQPDRRRRGRRTSGLRRQGTARERARRERDVGSPSRSSSAARSCFGSRTTATGWSPTTRGWRSSGMRRARSRPSDDLGAIRTLGFRGEALPSIASVSHFTLRTRARGEPTGTEVKVNGGAVSSVREVGAPEGTCIEVADLFYNLPARRKFLKSDTAEATQISRLVTQMALGYPTVGFSLTSGDARKLLECPPAAGLGERFFQLFGERPDLVEIRKEAAGLKIHGYIAALGDQGPVRGAQNVFVNRRIVKDRTIAHAISEAYSVATIKERSPGGAPVHRDPARPRRRQRPPDQGGGALSRAVAGARGVAPRPRRRARAGARPRAAVHAVCAASIRAAADDDPRRARRRDRRQPLGGRQDIDLRRPRRSVLRDRRSVHEPTAADARRSRRTRRCRAPSRSTSGR